jgi:uncharacterized Zn finger protein
VPGTRRGFGKTAWGAAWVEALETRARLDPNRLPRGRTYARWGNVGELAVGKGRVEAPVQGRRAAPYRVRVRVRELDAGEWDRLLDVVAAQVGHAAALLDGDLPPEVIDDARAAGLDLLPGPGELGPRCSCPDWADPCKHAAAVCYLVADVLDRDPFALLELRGRSREEVLAGLRARRAGEVPPGAAPEEEDPGVPARSLYERAERPPLPAVPLPPHRPGKPAVLVSDPPAGSGVDAAGLAALASDAAARAHQLATGAGDSGLGLDERADLARRAAPLVGTPGLEELARRASVPGRRLLTDALAWRQGGRNGLAVLTDQWQPEPADLAAGRAALGAGARARANRVTLGDRQLRLGADGRWYPYRRGAGGWEPDGDARADGETEARG